MRKLPLYIRLYPQALLIWDGSLMSRCRVVYYRIVHGWSAAGSATIYIGYNILCTCSCIQKCYTGHRNWTIILPFPHRRVCVLFTQFQATPSAFRIQCIWFGNRHKPVNANRKLCNIRILVHAYLWLGVLFILLNNLFVFGLVLFKYLLIFVEGTYTDIVGSI